MKKKPENKIKRTNSFPGLHKGESLDEATRSRMEALLGHDLRDVRIHQTRQAGEIARRLDAEAFTIGAHVFSGESVLTSPAKRSTGLLAHELTHVIQQTNPLPSGNTGRNTQKGQPVIQPGVAQVPSIQMNNNGFSAITGNTASAGMEAQARTSEQAAQRGNQGGGRTSAAEMDVEGLADLVYRMMQMEVLIEKDRLRR